MGGYEGADHLNGAGLALDMIRSTGHLDALDGDYAAAAAIGLRTVRESVGWRVCESPGGKAELRRVVRMAQSAERHGLQVIWTVMHYGMPADLSFFDDAMIQRFAAFAAAVARALAQVCERSPIYNPINEIGFLAWAVSATNLVFPYRNEARSAAAAESQGYAVKQRLVRASLAAIDAIRRVDPRARFLHTEPVVHVVAPADQPQLAERAEQLCAFQWQTLDMLCGQADAALGGFAEAVDIVGVNHYHSGQWETGTEQRLHWHLRDPRRKALADLLQTAWHRYRKPLIVAETSHVGVGRAQWLHEVASQTRLAMARGVPVRGLCLYPLIDRHDWNDATHWHRSGLWDAGERPAEARSSQLPGRVLCRPYADALQQWQQVLPPTPSSGVNMPYLIVLSHLRWGFVHQRPQHLLSRLAARFPVLFVEEPTFSDGAAGFDVVPQGPHLDVLVPHTPLPAHGFSDEQLPLLKPMLTDYLAQHGVDDYMVWLYTPMAWPFVADLQPRALIYDCMDELSAFKGAPPQLQHRELAVFEAADLVLTGGPALFEAKRHAHHNIHCLPSAVDAGHFAPDRLRADDDEAIAAAAVQAAIGTPRLGYFGVIDERLDLALLDRLACARPQWQIVMAGPLAKIGTADLPQRANLHWLGMQPYQRLPHLLASWDVCLMPFALNESTRFISPTKTLEYMAGHKPVVSTAVRDVIALYGEGVCIADSPAQFIEACDALLAEPADARQRRIATMHALVEASSWDRSAERVGRLIEQVLTRRGADPATAQEPQRKRHPLPQAI